MNLLIRAISISLFSSLVFAVNKVKVIYLTIDNPSTKWQPTSPKTVDVIADEGYQIQVDVLELKLDGEDDNYVMVKSLFAVNKVKVIYLTIDNPSTKWQPTSPKTVDVIADEGYQIQVDVLELKLDGEDDNYVMVKSLSDDAVENNGVMFTYTLSGTPSYLYNSNKVQAEYVGSNETYNEFVIQFMQVGEPQNTSTTSTTTEQPVKPYDQSQIFTTYLRGRSDDTFNQSSILELRETLKNMASEYCIIQQCPLMEKINTSNVNIIQIQRCPVSWEDHENCIILTFAIPIQSHTDDNDPKWDGYQLNSGHLQNLWDIYKQELLDQFKVSPYLVPNNRIFNHMIIFLSVALPVLIILVWLGRNKLGKKRRRFSDTRPLDNDINSDRLSQQSLDRHYLQEDPLQLPNTGSNL